MFRTGQLLPQVPIYGFIGGIPETFGGRTGVCLQRANAFAELDKRYIEILTLSPKHGVNPEALTERLRDEGRIGERVSIRNVWADLRRASDDELRLFAANSPYDDLPGGAEELLPYEGEFESYRTNSRDRRLQTDRFRDDGTRFVSYRNDLDKLISPTGRAATLFSRSGEVLGRWDEQYHLYFAWMDWLIGSGPTVVINDGPPLAKYLYKYRRNNIVFFQTIHSRHSSTPTSQSGLLSVKYLPILKHMDKFDRVAVLTQAQCDDIVQQQYGADNVVVLPNMFVANTPKRVVDRDRRGGLMLARLSHQKRIDLAIGAVERARRDHSADVTLDVYGVADDAEQFLEELIDDRGLGSAVHLRGYDPRAKARFEQASFSLLTSVYEGQPLVLLEAMAVGCIPIAFDIQYGPSDIITDGVNGFLVPDGDTAAMAEKIQLLQQMSDREVTAMRKAAVKRAKDFAPVEITRRWGKALKDALESKTPVETINGRAKLVSLSVDDEYAHLSLTISGEAAQQPDWARLMWEQRAGRGYGRVATTIRRSKNKVHIEGAIPISALTPYLKNGMDFWVDLRVRGNAVRLRIKGAPKTKEIATAGTIKFYGTKFGSLSAEAVAGAGA